jgi:hypothetical protein
MPQSYCSKFTGGTSGSLSITGSYIYYAHINASGLPWNDNPATVAQTQTMYNLQFPNDPATIVYTPSDNLPVNDYANVGTLSITGAYVYYAHINASGLPWNDNPATIPQTQTMYNLQFPNNPCSIVKLPPPPGGCTPTPTPTVTPTVTPTHTPTPTPTPGLQVGFKKWASFTTEGSSHEIEVEKKSGSIYIPNVKWTVDWKTVESGNNAVPGVATMGTSCGGATDFLEASGTIVFERYEGLKTFSVSSCSDSVTDPTETFDVQLFNLSAEDSYYDADPNAVVSFFPGTSSHIVWIQ